MRFFLFAEGRDERWWWQERTDRKLGGLEKLASCREHAMLSMRRPSMKSLSPFRLIKRLLALVPSKFQLAKSQQAKSASSTLSKSAHDANGTTSLNPYQPPPPIADGQIDAEANGQERPNGSEIGACSYREARSVLKILSGKPFIEYGVVFCVHRDQPNQLHAAIPLSKNDPMHREMAAVEAACVLQDLIARIAGLSPHVADRELVVSMISNYASITDRKYQVVLSPDDWSSCRRSST